MQEQHFPKASVNSQTIENRRSLLWRALAKNPNDPRLLDALEKSLTTHHIRKAASRGVFVCYSRSDELLALDLYTDLRAAGVRAWMDELEVMEEADWGKVVVNALRGCGLLLLILSPAALKDAMVQGERMYFLNTGKIVMPVIVEDCDISKLGLYVDPISFVDDYDIGLRQLIPLLQKPDEVATE